MGDSCLGSGMGSVVPAKGERREEAEDARDHREDDTPDEGVVVGVEGAGVDVVGVGGVAI